MKLLRVFAIAHQSPQILLIKDGVAVYVASHESIDVNVLIHHLIKKIDELSFLLIFTVIIYWIVCSLY